MPSVGARRGRLGGRRGAVLVRVARVEDALHTPLLATLGDRSVLGEIDDDALPADDVVLLPHARVADQHDALLEVVVLGALGGAGPAVLRDDAPVARRDGPEDPVTLLVQVDLHPVRVLHRAVLPGDDVAGEDDQALLPEPLHLVRIDGDRLPALLPRRRRRLVARGRLGPRRRRQHARPGRRHHRRGALHRGEGQCDRHDQRSPRSHCDLLPVTNVARTGPVIVVASSPLRTSRPLPPTTEPLRVTVTAVSVHRRLSLASQRSTAVSSRSPSLEVTTTLRRTSTLLVARSRSPSSPTIVHERSLW